MLPPEGEATEEEKKEYEEYQNALESAPIAIAGFLQQISESLRMIVDELRKANALYAGQDIPKPIVEKPTKTKVPSIAVPENLEDQDEIIAYYRSRLAEIETRNGEKFSEGTIEEFEFGVEENRVVMRSPWIGEKAKFAALINFVEKALNGKYVSKGKDTHFALPLP